jgi:hypothetical protein
MFATITFHDHCVAKRLIQWEAANGDELKLVESIETNTKHYVEILSRAVDASMPQPDADVTYVRSTSSSQYAQI